MVHTEMANREYIHAPPTGSMAENAPV